MDSSQDIRDHWGEWNYNERVEALDQLANETLDQYGYETDVSLDTGVSDDGYSGHFNPTDDSILLDPSVIEDPNPESAIHLTNHETVHAMNAEDGINDDTSTLYDKDFDITAEELEGFNNHIAVGDIARELDRDGFPPPAPALAPPPVTPQPGDSGIPSGYGGTPFTIPPQDLAVDIDWEKGVTVITEFEDGNIEFEFIFGEP